MSWVALKWAVKQATGSPAAKAVLMVLAEAASTKDASCYPSQATIAERSELSEKCVWEQLRELEQQGRITRHRRFDRRGHRTTDLIVLNLAVQAAPATDRKSPNPLAQGANRASPPPTASDAGRTGPGLAVGDGNPSRTSRKAPTVRGTEKSVSEPVREPVRLPQAPLPGLQLVAPVPRWTDAELVAAFERWWSAYPRRVGKKKAQPRYIAIVRNGEATTDELRAGAEAYAAERAGENPRFTKHPLTWLNGGHWADEPAPTQQAGFSGLAYASEVLREQCRDS